MLTTRLSLRRFTENDAAFILGLVNEPSWLEFIGDRGVRTLDDARAYIANGPVASYEKHGFGLYMVELRSDATPVGMCGLLRRETLEHPDIGYAFLPAYWSRGYASEAATAVMVHARELGLPRVLAITSAGNARSIRVLEKLGFTLVRDVGLETLVFGVDVGLQP